MAYNAIWGWSPDFLHNPQKVLGIVKQKNDFGNIDKEEHNGKNKHQKVAHKEGEERIGREELQELLELSHSDDPKDRETAASLIPDREETRAALVCENCNQVAA